MSGGRWQFDPVENRVIDTNVEPAREWISTRDALEHLRSVGLPPDGNRTRLVRWAAAGLLPARAIFLSDRGIRLPEGSLVPTSVWKDVLEGLWVKVCDLQAGSLKLLRLNLGPTLDVEAHGIEFDKAALLRLAPLPAQQDTTAAADPPIGRPTATGPYSASDEAIIARIEQLVAQGCPSRTAAAHQLWEEKILKGQSEEAATRRVLRKMRKRT